MTSSDTAGATLDAPVSFSDLDSLANVLHAACAGQDGTLSKKEAVVDLLKPLLERERAEIAEAFYADPTASRTTIIAYTKLAEALVKATVNVVMGSIHAAHVPTTSETMSIVFVGGSGRAEMAPFSDIDLLFLTPYKKAPWTENVLETVLHILWDLKLKVGYSVRTVNESLRMAREDITIRTNLLEMRYLMGDPQLATELEERLWSEVFENTGPQFVEAKLDERALRHERQGGSRYLVEPNVKEGKGGLRDLQTLFWIAKYLNRTKSVRELVDLRVLTEDEHQMFHEAETFLWSVRCLMHLINGRATEKLTFDLQVEVAKALGFEDQDGMRGVEQFMQQYFRHARHVGEITRIFLVDLEEKHVKQRPSLGTTLRNALSFARDKTAEGFIDQNGRLGIADTQAFLKDPVNILRLFHEALRTGLLLHPEAMRLVTLNLDLIDDDLRKNPEAAEIFFELLTDPKDPGRALLRMNELGVLGKFLPDFENIVAMMQFNMYHHYTVDEHTIRCITTLSEIEHQRLVEDLPVASEILKQGINRRVLYLALLLHDIGKGRPEAHEVIGAKIAKRVCKQLRMKPEETETVVWLVRHHLLMSDVAQKRDISEPRTVRDFAQAMRTTMNLKLLTVLTVCDIRGVGPDRWNNWKAVLIRQLYALTMDYLTEGSEAVSKSRAERIEEAKRLFAKRARFGEGFDLETEIDRHYAPFWVGTDIKAQLIMSKLSQDVKTGEILSDIQLDKDRDATRACFSMIDHPGIFARLTGALALAGANVVDARTYTTRDGVATSVFWLQDNTGSPYEKSRLGRLRKLIDRILKGEIVAREALKEKDVIKKRERPFIVPTTVSIDNEGSEIFTIIEVDTRDRPGLLHDLTRTLAASNLSISSAIIATYGNQVVDTFYVKDLFGLKVHSKAKQEAIEKKLREAIKNKQDPTVTP